MNSSLTSLIEVEDDGSSLVIPRQALGYVLLQRTDLQAIRRGLSRLRVPYPRFMIPLEAAVRGRAVAMGYLQQVRRDFLQVLPYLPDRADVILDIGCGMAGIDLFLHRHYRSSNGPELRLLDKSEVSEDLYYHFRSTAAFYNSLAVVERFMTLNGVEREQVRLVEVPASPSAFEGCDLVVSLLSWGYHYPVDTYLDTVARGLHPDGRVVLDIRRGTGGEGLVRGTFGWFRVIGEHRTRRRIVAGRVPGD